MSVTVADERLPIAPGVGHEHSIRLSVRDGRGREMQAMEECDHGLALTMTGAGYRALSR